MKIFEYKVLLVISGAPAQLEKELNSAGAEGWELVSITTQTVGVGKASAKCVLKREKAQ